MKRSILYLFILLFIVACTSQAQVDEMTKGIGDKLENEVIYELDGMTQSKEVTTITDDQGSYEAYEVVGEYSYSMASSFRSQMNHVANSYSDMSIVQNWSQIEPNIIMATYAIPDDPNGKVYVINAGYNTETNVSLFHISYVEQ